MNKQWHEYVKLIQSEVVPALGCTEPVALALAAATAVKELGKPCSIDKIEAAVSGNLMKNGMGVGVPGTGMKGLNVAAAAGAVGGNPDAKLEVLNSLTPENVVEIKKLLDANAVDVTVKDIDKVLYIECTVFSGEHKVTVIIEDDHTNITGISKDGEQLFKSTSSDSGDEQSAYLHNLAKCTTVAQIWDFALNAPLEMIEFIETAAELNGKISQAGLTGDYGLKIGKTMQNNIDKGVLREDLMTAVMRNSSAASDARMDGCALPVMANSGSGNQGIAATIPVLTTAQLVQADRETLLRALVLSHFTAIHIKSHLDKLSALCAVIVAAMGSSVGIVYLLEGNQEQAEFAIENMIGDVAGIICDGAKASCSLKVSSSVNAAVKAALLAIDNIRVTAEQGIVENDVEKVINNLGTLASEGMKGTDSTILNIMTSK